jgi:hypothetical protein
MSNQPSAGRVRSTYEFIKPTFPIWLPKIGNILHLLDFSLSNDLVASVASHALPVAT